MALTQNCSIAHIQIHIDYFSVDITAVSRTKTILHFYCRTFDLSWMQQFTTRINVTHLSKNKSQLVEHYMFMYKFKFYIFNQNLISSRNWWRIVASSFKLLFFRLSSSTFRQFYQTTPPPQIRVLVLVADTYLVLSEKVDIVTIEYR